MVVSIEVCKFTPKKMDYAEMEKFSRMASELKYALASNQSSAYSMRYVATSRT